MDSLCWKYLSCSSKTHSSKTCVSTCSSNTYISLWVILFLYKKSSKKKKENFYLVFSYSILSRKHSNPFICSRFMNKKRKRTKKKRSIMIILLVSSMFHVCCKSFITFMVSSLFLYLSYFSVPTIHFSTFLIYISLIIYGKMI